MWIWTAVGAAVGLGLLVCVCVDLRQKKHAILHNFPVVGHFRYWLEAIGPELRQYIVTSNNEERPFSRDQRRWVYASSKLQNNHFGFGTDNELETSPNYLIIRHSAFPINEARKGDQGFDSKYRIPCAKILGGSRRRAKAFRPASVVNLSAMSYGSLSGPAVEAMNRGCKLASCCHNTGEGGVSPHHQQGGELFWQIGTGYFGCRDLQGKFDFERCAEVVANNPIRALEIKLSQGAKPGRGGLLPAAKITAEIAKIRGIPRGQDCVSPSAHTAFGDVDSMLDFVERLAEQTGLPVGIKSAVGQMEFWHSLVAQMKQTGRRVDFITIDGGEGGTGAAPLVFSDHVSLPFKLAFSQVFRLFSEAGLDREIVFIGSGKLGFPDTGLFAFGLGCDMINVGREAMMAIGCIQAQKCHSGHCPTGVATQNRWLMSGLDPTEKSHRLANYVVTLRSEILHLCHACGVTHPALITPDFFDILDGCYVARSARECFGYGPTTTQRTGEDRARIDELMRGLAVSVGGDS
ncbi:MAG: FMN-binding glutamate synthase family protein [Planctomycetota bacterium]|nr:FMN-binding glutamate synthase family protein [Planctomycetota bacterium]MDA1178331.1 FMN-binding glutamate synthase family protein [Planctomycetota bacterium]